MQIEINEHHENDPAGPAMKMAVRFAGTLILVAMCAQLFGCGTLPGKTGVATPVRGNNPAVVAVQAARQQIGVPYRYGGSTPRGFDCSGLVHYAYLRAGIKVPRTTGELLRRAHRVPLAKLRPGDVLFFRIAPPKITHVGLYIGGSRFVHAPSSGKEVSYASLKDEYWKHHLVYAGRLF